MDFNPSTKRARSQSIEPQEPPHKKLCAAGLNPKRIEEVAELKVDMNVIAEKHGDGEPDVSAENGFDDAFDAEFEAAFDEIEGSLLSNEVIEGHASEDHAPEGQASEDDASGGHASEDHAPEDHASENRASVNMTLAKTSEETKSSTSSESPASSNSKKSSATSACSSPGIETSRTSIVDDSPAESIKSSSPPSTSPAKGNDRKRFAKSPPKYVGPSYRERRPLTLEDRDSVVQAINYTYYDLYKRTGVQLRTTTAEKGTSEQYDTTLESFAYQYARAQHRFKQYHGT